MATENTVTERNTTTAVEAPDFGNGKYSRLQQQVWEQAQIVFGIPADKAEKLARKIAQEWGAVMANQTVDIKVGRKDKDGKVSLSEASKIKGITVTNEIACLRALAFAQTAGEHHFLWSRTKWEVTSGLREYLNRLGNT
jgi:hypothetical protein